MRCGAWSQAVAHFVPSVAHFAPSVAHFVPWVAILDAEVTFYRALLWAAILDVEMTFGRALVWAAILDVDCRGNVLSSPAVGGYLECMQSYHYNEPYVMQLYLTAGLQPGFV